MAANNKLLLLTRIRSRLRGEARRGLWPRPNGMVAYHMSRMRKLLSMRHARGISCAERRNGPHQCFNGEREGIEEKLSAISMSANIKPASHHGAQRRGDNHRAKRRNEAIIADGIVAYNQCARPDAGSIGRRNMASSSAGEGYFELFLHRWRECHASRLARKRSAAHCAWKYSSILCRHHNNPIRNQKARVASAARRMRNGVRLPMFSLAVKRNARMPGP